MKLSFRDLKQQKFTIDAEPSDTIGQVKEKIASEKGWDASSQKLIYSGKILADTNTVESYKIEEKGFIVCMVSKPKTAAAPKSAPAPAPAPAPAQTPATPAVSSSTPAPPPAPQQSNTSTTATTAANNPPPTPTPAQSAQPAAASGGAGFNDPSAMLVGNRNQAVMTEMEAMGFPREEAERALRAAYYNPDRAIEYLLNGIPEHVQVEQRAAQQQQQQQQQQQAQAQRQPAGQQQTPASPTPAAATTTQTPAALTTEGDEPINLFEAAAQAGQGGRGAGARGAGAGAAPQGQAAATGVNMDFLRHSPHFQHLRQLVQQQPAMLEPILQQVAEGNPQLAQMIGQNQEQFLQLLSEDLAGNEGGALPPGAITVSPEEAAAIQRLCDLGFPRERVIQAYFACDKNEELAANFLFEQPDDDEA